MVEIRKVIRWEYLDEIKKSIQEKLNLEGFLGKINVSILGGETLEIVRNKQLTNFFHSQATMTLCVLSVFLLIPYYIVSLMLRKCVLKSEFHVRANKEFFWGLIRDGLNKRGFNPLRGGNRERRQVLAPPNLQPTVIGMLFDEIDGETTRLVSEVHQERYNQE